MRITLPIKDKEIVALWTEIWHINNMFYSLYSRMQKQTFIAYFLKMKHPEIREVG